MRKRPALLPLVPRPRPAKTHTLRPVSGDPDRRIRKHLPQAPKWMRQAVADLLVDIVPALKRG